MRLGSSKRVRRLRHAPRARTCRARRPGRRARRDRIRRGKGLRPRCGARGVWSRGGWPEGGSQKRGGGGGGGGGPRRILRRWPAPQEHCASLPSARPSRRRAHQPYLGRTQDGRHDPGARPGAAGPGRRGIRRRDPAQTACLPQSIATAAARGTRARRWPRAHPGRSADVGAAASPAAADLRRGQAPGPTRANGIRPPPEA